MNRSLGEVDVDCYGPEDSVRSDEQAQSQDRERQIQEAWDNLMYCVERSYGIDEADIKLLKWALGVK